MKVRELIRYSRQLLSGRRAKTMGICMLPLAAELFFRFAEAAVYSLMLYFGGGEPIRLFGGYNPAQLVVAVVCTLLRWVTAAPLMYAAVYRLYGITSERAKKRADSFSRILFRKCTFRRSITAALWTKIVGLLALIPVIFFGTAAYTMLHGRLRSQEAFLAMNAVFLAAVSVIFWLSLKLSFAAVPYLLVRYPKLTSFRTVLYSLRFMSGRKSVPLRLMVMYLPQMVTIIGLPAAITGLRTAFSLSIDIFIKEDEYLETDRADSRCRKARHSGKISSRKKRHIEAAADEA